jgi:hypothetical protein
MPTQHDSRALLHLRAAAAVAAALTLAPAMASAQLRASAFGGVEAMRRDGATAVGRVEATLAFLPFLHFGAYLSGTRDFNEARSVPSVGGLVAFRPPMPFTRWSPMAFASYGWMRQGDDDGTMLQLGGGLVRQTLPFLDFELRGAFVQHMGLQQGNTGVQIALGLSLHP